MLDVTDDSGFLALVVPTVYEGFVDRDWQLDQLLRHFRAQMAKRTLLIWGTGCEGCWRVDVRRRRSRVRGFREVSGPIRVSGKTVLVTNYESLTMAAQFAEVHLPEKYQRNLLIEIPDGDYCCRVVQMFDPDEASSARPGQPDFVLEITRPDDLPAPWTEIPWFSL